MIIQINNRYRIRSDEHSWMVQRFKGTRQTDEGEKEEWQTVYWLSSFESALISLTELRVRHIDDNATAKEIEGLLRTIKQESERALVAFKNAV